MRIRQIQPYRRLLEALQALVILGLPFLTVKGESALRFDIPSLRLHFFGISLWMDEFFLVLIAIIFLTFLIVLITLMFGRIWCGWLCPQTVLVDFARFVDRALKKGFASGTVSYLLTFLVSLIVAASLIWYFVSPYEFFGRLFAGDLGTVIAGFWAVMTGIIFLDLAFLRHRFCATVCPYAKMQSALFDNNTLMIGFDPRRKEECMNCMACVRACPVGIDIRDGMNAACINCAECVDTCSEMMGRRQKRPLINYSFGMPGEKTALLRQNVYMIGLLTLVFFAFLLYLSFSRVQLDMTVLPNFAYPPRRTVEGDIVNSYLLSLENKGRTDRVIGISARGTTGDIRIIPEKLLIRAGEHRKIPAYVIVSSQGKEQGMKDIELIVESKKPDDLRTTVSAHFIIPEQ